MHLFINCLAASSGSGLTYVHNIVPQIAARPELRATLALPSKLRSSLGSPPNVSFVEFDIPAGAAGRFFWEQSYLRRVVRGSAADVLISAGNFALRRSPLPQILLSGNCLYTCTDFYSDLLARRAYRVWLDTRIRGFFARRSVRWADCTVAPSQTFAETLQSWTEGRVVGIHHGFDQETFFDDDIVVPPAIRNLIDYDADVLRLIFVSHYNYYRNFETLLRAVPYIKERLGDRRVQLVLTCKFTEKDSGYYKASSARQLIRQLGISHDVVELGAVPYSVLQHVIRACHIYVTAAYAETFAHPLVEAMACGLPIVASDLPVHREICGDAAIYFPRFSPHMLAERVIELDQSLVLRKKLSAFALKRSRDFSWRDHLDQIVGLAQSLKHGSLEYAHAA
jgi:glycosyltransferase involved in cell wall biosynthesis